MSDTPAPKSKVLFVDDDMSFLQMIRDVFGDASRGAWDIQTATSGGDAQAKDTYAGKVLRINDDGSVPKDNPFVGQAGWKPEIYSFGHRSSLGLGVHPTTGELWQSENGPNGGDELNILVPGGNYGWPLVSLGRTYQGPWHSQKFQREGFIDPVVYWTPAIAISGLTFYTGDRLPKWKGDVFVGGLRYGEIIGTGQIQRILFNEKMEELRREALLTAARAAATVGDAVGARGVPCHADEERSVVAVVGGPPCLRVGHECGDVLDHCVEVQLLELLGVVVVLVHRVADGGVVVQHLEVELVRPPVDVPRADSRCGHCTRHRALAFIRHITTSYSLSWCIHNTPASARGGSLPTSCACPAEAVILESHTVRFEVRPLFHVSERQADAAGQVIEVIACTAHRSRSSRSSDAAAACPVRQGTG